MRASASDATPRAPTHARSRGREGLGDPAHRGRIRALVARDARCATSRRLLQPRVFPFRKGLATRIVRGHAVRRPTTAIHRMPALREGIRRANRLARHRRPLEGVRDRRARGRIYSRTSRSWMRAIACCTGASWNNDATCSSRAPRGCACAATRAPLLPPRAISIRCCGARSLALNSPATPRAPRTTRRRSATCDLVLDENARRVPPTSAYVIDYQVYWSSPSAGGGGTHAQRAAYDMAPYTIYVRHLQVVAAGAARGVALRASRWAALSSSWPWGVGAARRQGRWPRWLDARAAVERTTRR